MSDVNPEITGQVIIDYNELADLRARLEAAGKSGEYYKQRALAAESRLQQWAEVAAKMRALCEQRKAAEHPMLNPREVLALLPKEETT